jgi:hypothetical protein
MAERICSSQSRAMLLVGLALINEAALHITNKPRHNILTFAHPKEAVFRSKLFIRRFSQITRFWTMPIKLLLVSCGIIAGI